MPLTIRSRRPVIVTNEMVSSRTCWPRVRQWVDGSRLQGPVMPPRSARVNCRQHNLLTRPARSGFFFAPYCFPALVPPTARLGNSRIASSSRLPCTLLSSDTESCCCCRAFDRALRKSRISELSTPSNLFSCSESGGGRHEQGFFLPGELDEHGERLKIEFGIDRLILSPAIEDRLLRLQAADQRQAQKENAHRQARRVGTDAGQPPRTARV